MKITILPYCEVDGIRTIPNSDIRGFYDRMVKDGVADTVFHAGDVTSPNDFLKHVRSPGVFLYVVESGGDPAGLIWLTHVEFRSCRVHFTAFSEFMGPGSVDIGGSAISTIMFMKNPGTGDYLFDSLFGLLPAFNTRALKWLEAVGMKRTGVMPKSLWSEKKRMSVDGILFCLTRDILEETNHG